jgi:type I restriction enzyme R subunit
MVKDFIAASASVTADDMEYSPFIEKGGLGRYYQLFGEEYEALLDEMNLVLAA